MTKRQFVVIAFRLFAIYFTINLITNLNTYYDIIYQLSNNDRQMLLVSACSIFIALLFITLLWIKSEWLMEKIFAIPVLSETTQQPPPEPNPNVQTQTTSDNLSDTDDMTDYYETPISVESVQLIALSLIGIWATLNYLPIFLRDLEIFIDSSSSGSLSSLNRSYRGQENMALLASSNVVSLGIWLFLRPWQFQGLIQMFKRNRIEKSAK